jgi:hypothetical protein
MGALTLFCSNADSNDGRYQIARKPSRFGMTAPLGPRQKPGSAPHCAGVTARVLVPVADGVKIRPAVRAAGNRLAINHAGFASKTSLGSPP